MFLLDGKIVRDIKLKELKKKSSNLEKRLKVAIIKIGENSSSDIYLNNIIKIFETLDFKYHIYNFEENVKETELKSVIEKLNFDNSIDGIMIQLPVPKNINIDLVRNMISPEKDIDGLTDENIKKLKTGEDGLIPCTPLAVLELLKYYNIDLNNKNICIVGRSISVGQPLYSILLRENLKVDLCHSKTQNLKEHTLKADILVVAVGKEKLINSSYIKENAVVIDVGINVTKDGKIIGDVDISNSSSKIKSIAPVPGGVGPITVYELANNVYEAHIKKKNNS